ncbi:MAG TPA: cell division protein SepF [Acidimicrobiales bacterium]|nr:cell division protein SepF [Acidimicrobiales bacterium]
MSGFRRMMSYLGLVDDEEYDEYEAYDDRGASQASPAAVQPRQPRSSSPGEGDLQGGTIRTLPREGELSSGVTVARPSSVVRPLTPITSSKPVTVTPASFQDAKEIGDRLKAGVPVIVNLQGADRDLLRRIVDFASGLTYGLDGEMERTADRVYLLTPTQRG